MFENCKNFNQPLNNWNVSNVKVMSNMFKKQKNLISHWIIGMLVMFTYALHVLLCKII